MTDNNDIKEIFNVLDNDKDGIISKQEFEFITKELGYDMYSVESEVWWFFFGFGMILGLRALTKSYKWARRSFCDHCGKELKK